MLDAGSSDEEVCAEAAAVAVVKGYAGGVGEAKEEEGERAEVVEEAVVELEDTALGC